MSELTDPTRARLERALSDRYAIRSEAGRGGMATVYEAFDVKHNRTVAIKVLHHEHRGPGDAERFLREIQIAAGLNHPHIMAVLDSGNADGLLFYVMPFVAGETLRDRMRRTPNMPWADALKVVREICQALSYAHSAGVVHRDLKPENIMVATGIAVVTDFGIARAAAFEGNQALTQTGSIIGTPSYMSPEQASGERTLSGRSDIYSVGCMLFEMLTGSPPFTGPSALAVLSEHMRTPVPSVRGRRGDLPADVDRVLARAMAKDPAARYGTIDELLAALDGIGGGARGAVVARAMAARHRRVVLVGGLALLVAGAAWLATRSMGREAGRAAEIPVVAVLPFQHIGRSDDAYITEGIAEEISNRIADVGGIRVIARASAMQFDLARKSLADVARELHATFVIVGSIQVDHDAEGVPVILALPKLLRVSDGGTVWDDRLEAPLAPGRMFALQSRIARGVAEGLNISLRPESVQLLEDVPTRDLDAYRYFLRGTLLNGSFLIRDEQKAAIDMYERATASDTNFALAYARLAQATATYFSQFDRSPARLQSLEAAVSRAQALDPTGVETGIARGYLELFARRNPTSAMAEFLSARERKPNSATLQWVIGFVQRQQGDFDGAAASFAAAASLDPRSPVMLLERGTIYFLQRRYDELEVAVDSMLQLSPDWLPGIIGKATSRMYHGQPEVAKRGLADRAALADRLVVQLLGEPVHRPYWELLVPDTMWSLLRELPLRGGIDSAHYYFAKGLESARRGRAGPAAAYNDSLLVMLRRRTAGRTPTMVEFGFLAFAALGLGDSAQALRLTDSLVASNPTRRDAFRGSFALLEAARLYARLGATEQALSLLEALRAVPSPVASHILRADVSFARLRTHPRFVRLLAQSP